MKQEDLIKNLFEDFQLLKTFKVDIKVKKRLLKELLEAGPDPWRIIGITGEALALLKKHNYNKVKGIKIQRAHLKDRDIWYGELFEKKWEDASEWYSFINKKDKTVLALSSENKSISKIHYIRFGRRNSVLFRSKRITWTHKKEEMAFLKKLDESNNTKVP